MFVGQVGQLVDVGVDVSVVITIGVNVGAATGVEAVSSVSTGVCAAGVSDAVATAVAASPDCAASNSSSHRLSLRVGLEVGAGMGVAVGGVWLDATTGRLSGLGAAGDAATSSETKLHADVSMRTDVIANVDESRRIRAPLANPRGPPVAGTTISIGETQAVERWGEPK